MMYLSVMHFKWTNVVCLSIDMLISSMMDVVIISAKFVSIFVWFENGPM
jgi:hypothetical protein